MSAGAAGGAVVRCGHLRKLKTMKKKYFVLRGDTPDCSARLEYYESEKKFTSGATPRRELPLRSCFNITRRLDLRQKHVIALFTKEEQFCVVAESEAELQEWLAALLQLHRADDASDHLQHPIQHVWQVNVQKKGLGASKNIQGLYNLCLTDKTLTLVKIKSYNNVISDLGIPERVEYSLKNIRRCGDSECFFYMEVGRQTVTGAGELWMLCDDSNIAQSMHSTIYHAMRNCAKETENERDHIILPSKGSLDSSHPLPARRQTYSDGRGRAGLLNDKALCVGACMAQCVCSSATYSIEDSAAAIAPLAPVNSAAVFDPSNNTLTSDKTDIPRLIKHHRTVSLPTGCALFQEPLKISHGRTRSAPLTGEEVDKVMMEKAVMHSSCKTFNGTDVFPNKKNQWARRASTGARLSKLSPAHTKNAASLRSRCDSMPARTSSCDVARLVDSNEALDGSRDEPDADWLRTPRIPEEPDLDDRSDNNYLCMTPPAPRLSEFQLEPVPALISDEGVRPARAYSVGSAPSQAAHAVAAPAPRAPHRTRAYSAGARRPTPHLMELDFTPPGKQSLSRSPAAPVAISSRPDFYEYVDMSPRSTTNESRRAPDGYVEMTYGRPRPSTSLTDHNDINSLYMKMNAKTESENNLFTRMKAKTDSNDSIYTRMNSKNNSEENLYKRIKSTSLADREERVRKDSDETYGRVKPPSSLVTERSRDEMTPHGSQTIFPFSPEDEAHPPASTPSSQAVTSLHDAHPLTTVSELSEDTCGVRHSESFCESDISSSPASYVRLKPQASLAIDVPQRGETNLTATVVVSRDNPRIQPPLNYAALDLEPRRVPAPNAPANYTQIDFVRSDKLHADVN